MIDLSIIIPYRDTPLHLLKRLLYSIPTSVNSCVKWEVCIVDDASKRKLSKTNDFDDFILSKIDLKIIRLHSHSGISKARQAGFQSTTGDHVTFFDSDDALRPYGLDQMMQLAKENTVVFADHAVFPENGIKPYHRRKEHWTSLVNRFRYTASCPFLFCNFMVMPVISSRSLLTKIGGYPFCEYAGEHVSYYGALARQTCVDFSHLPYTVYEYWPRNNGHSLSNPRLHMKGKAKALINEAKQRGFQNWCTSEIVAIKKNDAALYLHKENNKLIIPIWSQVDVSRGLWEFS